MRSSKTQRVFLFLLIGVWCCLLSCVFCEDAVNAKDQSPLANISKDNSPKELSNEAVGRAIYAALEGKGEESGIAIIGLADPTTLRLSVAFWLEHCGDFWTLYMQQGLKFVRDGKGKIDYEPTNGMSLWTVSGVKYVWDANKNQWKLSPGPDRQPQSWSENFLKSHYRQAIHMPFYFENYHGDWPIMEGPVRPGWKNDSGEIPRVSAEQVSSEMKKFLNDSGDSRIFAIEAVDAYLLPELLKRWQGEGHFYGNVQRVATVEDVFVKYDGGKRTIREQSYKVDAGGFRTAEKKSMSSLLDYPKKPENTSSNWDAAKVWVNDIFHKMNYRGPRNIKDIYASQSNRLWIGWTPLRRGRKGTVALDPKATWPITFITWDGSYYQLLPNGEAFVLGIANYTWSGYWSWAGNAGRLDKRNVLLIFMSINKKKSSVAYEALLLQKFPWGSSNPFLAYCASRIAPDKLVSPFTREEEKK